MIDPDMRRAIYRLHKEGMGKREIARRLKIHRKTVQAIIDQKGAMPTTVRADKIQIDPELLRRLYAECEGFKQRMHEKLVEEEKIDIKYSTLTRLVRELEIGRPPKVRCDRVADVPGAEMQHDTTVYTRKIAGKPTRIIASCLYLRYSKRRYVKFYRVFNRFTMKCFFHEALTFWGYCAIVCIIDNTNLARLRGTGKDAVIVPEMEAFAEQYGFRFRCHELGHSNRKAGEERSFHTVETNFFPGRTFESLEDMNEQAFEWATVRLYHRPVAKTHLIPAKAFEHERPYLVELAAYLPAPYLILDRGTDQYGYTQVAGNYYWVPGTKRDDVTVLRYADRLKIYRRRVCLAEYPLAADGVKNQCFSPKGHPTPAHQPQNRRNRTEQEEKKLRAMGDPVGAYLDFALEPKGIRRHRFVRALYRLAQQMSPALLSRTVERALKYRIRSLETLERIAHLLLTQGAEAPPYVEADESYRERAAYQEGRLTDEPDFSAYDGMLEADDG